MLIQKILIIDDNPDEASHLTDKMESFGFECFTFTSISAALEGIQNLTPDLILMEVGFAQTRGAQFLNKIRESLSQEDNLPPVIVMNGEDDLNLIEYAFDLGTYELFTNPYQNMPLGNGGVEDYLPSEEDEEKSLSH